nr:hypothetical protein [Chloroflexia bacterium]
MTADVLEEASRALFQLGRTFARMPLRGILASPTGRGVELSSILVVQAIAAAAGEEQE